MVYITIFFLIRIIYLLLLLQLYNT